MTNKINQECPCKLPAFYAAGKINERCHVLQYRNVGLRDVNRFAIPFNQFLLIKHKERHCGIVTKTGSNIHEKDG